MAPPSKLSYRGGGIGGFGAITKFVHSNTWKYLSPPKVARRGVSTGWVGCNGSHSSHRAQMTPPEATADGWLQKRDGQSLFRWTKNERVAPADDEWRWGFWYQIAHQFGPLGTRRWSTCRCKDNADNAEMQQKCSKTHKAGLEHESLRG